MIINFHPKERESKKGVEVIAMLQEGNAQEVFHVTDKTTEEWQTIINSDEKLILVAPTYWWGLSYEFDRWAQNVLSYGYAYRYTAEGMPEGLLNGRVFELHTTQGTPEMYAKNMRANMKERLEVGIFGFCNANVEVIFHVA